jgi:hypothetical protein
MITFLKNTEIDKKKWDDCIQDSMNSLLYAYSWYLDLLAPGWCALVKDDYLSVMPLPTRKKMGIEYVFQPFFAQQLGVFSKEEQSPEILEEFISNIPSEIKYIDTNLNIYNPVAKINFPTVKATNYELDLSGKAEDLFKNYSSNTKRNIKKSKKLIKIDENIPVKELIRLKSENTRPRRSAKFYIWMSTFVEQLLLKGHGKLIGAKVDGNLVAAALFGLDNKRVYYLIPVSDNEGKELRAMFSVIDFVIDSYAGSGKILDFEGSDIKGIARFFDGFGAKAKYYHKLKINRLPLPLRFFKK